MTLVSDDITSSDFTDCLAPHSPFLFLLSISRPSPVSERLEQATRNVPNRVPCQKEHNA